MKYDIVLIVPPSRAFNHYRPPMSYLYLGGYLTNKGKSVKIIDKKSLYELSVSENYALADKVAEEVEKIESKIVGFSCYSTEYPILEYLGKAIKKKRPDITIIVGGIHPTLFTDDFFFEGSPFDIAVLGEGETRLYEIVEALNKGESVENVKGIAFNKNGKTIKTELAPINEELDSFSFPDFSLVDMDYYMTPNPFAVRGLYLRAGYTLISRGSPSNCTFCVNKNLKNFTPGRIRYRSIDKVIEELLLLKEKYGADGFYILDDAFTLNREYTHALCDALIKNKVNMLWGCTTRINAVNFELLKHMREAKCMQIDFGVESGSEKMLKVVKKGIKVEKIIEVFDYCRKLGIRTFANMLFNLPSETEEDVNLSFELLDKIKANVVLFNFFMPLPGTDLAEQVKMPYEKHDYGKLECNVIELMKEDKRFRYAEHNLDYESLFKKAHFKYNRLSDFVKAAFEPDYLLTLLRSKHKLSYLKSGIGLMREFIRQKNLVE